jgi:hypothetical protein
MSPDMPVEIPLAVVFVESSCFMDVYIDVMGMPVEPAP